MTAAIAYRIRLHLALVIALPIVVVLNAIASADDVEALRPAPARLEATDECRRCHFPRPGEGAPLAADSFCTEEEAEIWEKQDKHRQAFQLLISAKNRPLSEQILGFSLADVLSLPPDGQAAPQAIGLFPGADARKIADVRQCLACHAPIAEPVSRGAAQLTLASGVSCQACHGPGRAYMTPHQDSTNVWRIVKADIKESLFGMRDLRNPVKRAALCASCHVGSFSSQWKADDESPPRFVKHEWYAKGHPPLPSFEFVAFSRQMPLHWRSLQTKLAQQKFAWYDAAPVNRDLEAEIARFLDNVPRSVKIERSGFAATYREANAGSFSEQPTADLARSKDVLVSGLGVLSAYASLLAEVPDDERADFALYDCGACHHELRSQFPSAARVRRNLPPGRPPPAYWTLALARQGAQRSGHRAALEAAIRDLDEACGARPFGDAAAVKGAATRLELVCTSIGRELAAGPLDDVAGAELLASLADPQHDEDRDYHSARQLAWAIREVLSDLASADSKQMGQPLSPALAEALGFPPAAEIMPSDVRVRGQIDGLFGDDAWQGPLRLRLPAGQHETIVGRLPESLSAISSYDPAWFRDRLKPIQQAFPRR